jgi:hypothetical protein
MVSATGHEGRDIGFLATTGSSRDRLVDLRRRRRRVARKLTYYGGKTHTAHEARVRHAWDARLEAGSQGLQSGVGERAARSLTLDRVSRRRGPRRAAGASLV